MSVEDVSGILEKPPKRTISEQPDTATMALYTRTRTPPEAKNIDGAMCRTPETQKMVTIQQQEAPKTAQTLPRTPTPKV